MSEVDLQQVQRDLEEAVEQCRERCLYQATKW